MCTYVSVFYESRTRSAMRQRRGGCATNKHSTNSHHSTWVVLAYFALTSRASGRVWCAWCGLVSLLGGSHELADICRACALRADLKVCDAMEIIHKNKPK